MTLIQRITLPFILFLLFFSGAAHAKGTQWISYSDAMKRAQTENKLVYLYFYSEHCPWCVRMEKEVLDTNDVAAYLNKNFLSVKIHVDDEPLLASLYRVRGFPSHVFLAEKGEETLFSRPGYLPEGSFLRMLEFIQLAKDKS